MADHYDAHRDSRVVVDGREIDVPGAQGDAERTLEAIRKYCRQRRIVSAVDDHPPGGNVKDALLKSMSDASFCLLPRNATPDAGPVAFPERFSTGGLR